MPSNTRALGASPPTAPAGIPRTRAGIPRRTSLVLWGPLGLFGLGLATAATVALAQQPVQIYTPSVTQQGFTSLVPSSATSPVPMAELPVTGALTAGAFGGSVGAASSTILAGGTATRVLCITNVGAAGSLWINQSGGAAVVNGAGSVPLASTGSQRCWSAPFLPSNAVTGICSTGTCTVTLEYY